MAIFETLLYSSLLFGFLTLLLIPLGYLILGAVLPDLRVEYRVLLAFGLSSLLFGAGFTLGVVFGVPNSVLRLIFAVVGLGSLFIWAKRGGSRDLFKRNIAYGLLLMFVYYLFVVFSSAFPEGNFRDVSAVTIQSLSGYPIDNLIPFNVSRIFVERIDPALVEVVPNWSLAERGPFAGIIVAFVFVLLGVEESAHWLSASPGIFFLFEAQLVYLNALSLLALWTLANKIGGMRMACAASLLLGSTFFFFLNVFYSWPKFFMAYLVISALALFGAELRTSRAAVVGGLLLAGAILAHDIAIFYIVSLFSLWILRWILGGRILRGGVSGESPWPPQVTLRYGLNCLLSLFLALSPWLAFKALYGSNSRRMLYLHLFCVRDQNVSDLSFFSAARRYVSEHGVLGILEARIDNLLYPFDITAPMAVMRGQLSEFYHLARVHTELSYFHLVFALGVPLLLLSIVGLFGMGREKERDRECDWENRNVCSMFTVGFGGLLVAVSLFGCPQTTWNHAWVYPLFVLLMLPAAWTLLKERWWLQLLFIASIGFNTLTLVFGVWFREDAASYLHADVAFLATQAALYLIFLSVGFVGLMRHEEL